MTNKLKHFRVEAELTQAEVAKAVGISQPQYQRWESGQAEVPAGKLKKLASAFSTTEAALLGRHPPVKAAYYDESAPENTQYYGEVAIHFAGGGEPLLLSISEAAFAEAHRDFQGSAPFVRVESLSNQRVMVRRAAVADLYFSSEAHDTHGPEHGQYKKSSSLHLPDPRDWEIIEAILDDLGQDEFDPESVERLEKILAPTSDEEFEKLVQDGSMDEAGVIAAQEREARRLDRIHTNATSVVYQLSDGKQRKVYLFEDDELYNALSEFCTDEDLDLEVSQPLVRFASEGYHRTLFINSDAIDYISAPIHRWEKGRTEVEGSLLDS
ncbi:helix-turn-helix domain-containing protein [Rhizobium sp. BK176]|uniref:helix-turn-helix domain-containing protein n=1 Tax=Rhizobium sp. BK176 TaxID=2587071 RepID=UPI002167D126|nr:helix-turn-helix transcriptional regulator [Rhizobium sp. BK176]MCS4089300.1 transcriptional regulator with XRE-family HTH domain [Rhizobium sp. BK176]